MRDIIKKLLNGNKKPHQVETSDGADEAAPPAKPVLAEESPAPVEPRPAETVPEETVPEEPFLELAEEPEDDIPTFSGDLAEADTGLERLPSPSLETASLAETLISRAKPVSENSYEPLLRAAQRCHVGAVRSRNEDSSFTFVSTTGGKEPLLPFGLFIVADGMGGHFAGHEASKVASRTVAEQVLNLVYLPLLKQNGATAQGPQKPVQEVFEQAVQSANQALFNPDPEKDSGTTLTAVLILGRRLYLAHVGDSRAYLLSDGQLQQLTTDHSYVQRLQTVGQLTAEEAASHPHRNVLYRAVGQGGELEIDTYTRSLTRPGKLILCSDGLWGLAPDSMIQEVLEDDLPLESMVDKLLLLALQGGGHDNITAIVVDYAL